MDRKRSGLASARARPLGWVLCFFLWFFSCFWRALLSEKLGIVAYVHGIVCFTNPRARLEVQEPTVTVIHITNLKSFFQTLEEQEALSEQEVRRIKAEVEKYSYSRPREKHV